MNTQFESQICIIAGINNSESFLKVSLTRFSTPPDSCKALLVCTLTKELACYELIDTLSTSILSELCTVVNATHKFFFSDNKALIHVSYLTDIFAVHNRRACIVSLGCILNTLHIIRVAPYEFRISFTSLKESIVVGDCKIDLEVLLLVESIDNVKGKVLESILQVSLRLTAWYCGGETNTEFASWDILNLINHNIISFIDDDNGIISR